MNSFKNFVQQEEAPDELHGMHRALWQYFGSASAPMNPDPIDSGAVPVNEVTLLDKRLDSGNFPKTSRYVEQAENEIGGQNHHKAIQTGFAAANGDINDAHKLRAAKTTMKEFFRSRGYNDSPKLLTENGKTMKSTGIQVHTKALFLAPHALAGLRTHKDGHHFDVCPNASTECRANCLGTESGGNKQYPDSSLASKVAKTHFMVSHPEEFARVLHHEIGAHTRGAQRKGMVPGVRLNGTSDIAFEKHLPNMFAQHKGTEFYDYTKNVSRVLGALKGGTTHPSNYHLALSHTGSGHAESNDTHASRVLEAGGILATVFHGPKKGPYPTHIHDRSTGKMYPIVNGDSDDHLPSRHAQIGKSYGDKGEGVGSGLRLKGVSPERAGKFSNPIKEHGGTHVIEIN